mgnify:FL=1
MKEGDNIYFEHRSWRFDLYEGLSENILNTNLIKTINQLNNSYEEVFFVTNIEPYNVGFLKDINSALDKNIKILILSTIPNTDKKLNSLECYIKRKSCKYSKSRDYEARNLISYYKNIQNIINSNVKGRFLLFDSYDAICANETCYSYDYDKDLLTHVNDSHLTIEGSLSIKD